jgi:hypothetical protein
MAYPPFETSIWKAYKSILRRFYQNKKYEAKVEAEADSEANVKAVEVGIIVCRRMNI